MTGSASRSSPSRAGRLASAPLALSGLALPGLALPGLALPGLALPGLALPGLALPGLASPALAGGTGPCGACEPWVSSDPALRVSSGRLTAQFHRVRAGARAAGQAARSPVR